MAPQLEKLGSRICIIGPSCSGKSTLAYKLAQKLGCEAIHLDQIAHSPRTNWKRRGDREFITLHVQTIKQDSWVLDGNYSITMPERLQRATAVIWLDPPLTGCILRYLLRCLKSRSRRVGDLEGAARHFSIKLIHFTLTIYPKNRQKYERLLSRFNKPIIRINSMRALNRLYQDLDLCYNAQ